MTLKSAQALLRQIGYTITSRPEFREYEVTRAGERKGDGYFTDSLEDAVGTAKAMAGLS